MRRTSLRVAASWLLLVTLSVVPSLFGCISAGQLAPESQPRESKSGLYTLELSRSFDAREAPNAQYDSFFAWAGRDWVVGVIVDQPSQPMERLDEAVRTNALESELPAEVVRVRDVELGGLYARRTEIVLDVDGNKMLMLNTHTSTEAENLQLIVSGPLRDARALRGVADALEGGGFRFLRRVAERPVVAPYDLADPTLPVRFRSKPEKWQSAERGSVNEHAFLELTVPEQDLWFMGIHELLEGDVAAEAASDPEYLDRYARLMHDEMASVLQAVPPGDLEPFDAAGEGADRRWSLGGHFIDGQVPITYRFRLVQRGPEVVRLYCWGQPTVDVKAACDGLFDLISLADPAPSAPAAE